jgi:hypothetical protein
MTLLACPRRARRLQPAIIAPYIGPTGGIGGGAVRGFARRGPATLELRIFQVMNQDSVLQRIRPGDGRAQA